MKNVVLNILTALSWFTATSICAGEQKPPSTYSMVAVLANPSAFDSKIITIYGYATFRNSTACYIFLTQDDCDIANTRNGFRIIYPSGAAPEITTYKDGYVSLVGSFHSKNSETSTNAFQSSGAIEISTVTAIHPVVSSLIEQRSTIVLSIGRLEAQIESAPQHSIDQLRQDLELQMKRLRLFDLTGKDIKFYPELQK
jgi:hypothetical protein